MLRIGEGTLYRKIKTHKLESRKKIFVRIIFFLYKFGSLLINMRRGMKGVWLAIVRIEVSMKNKWLIISLNYLILQNS